MPCQLLRGAQPSVAPPEPPRSLATSESLQLQWVSPDRFHAAAAFFARHNDKERSFTDCVSFALMHEMNIRDSFTTDRHFRQAGFNPLL
jgi:predicted nucleic acid-binding protein